MFSLFQEGCGTDWYLTATETLPQPTPSTLCSMADQKNKPPPHRKIILLSEQCDIPNSEILHKKLVKPPRNATTSLQYLLPPSSEVPTTHTQKKTSGDHSAQWWKRGPGRSDLALQAQLSFKASVLLSTRAVSSCDFDTCCWQYHRWTLSSLV